MRGTVRFRIVAGQPEAATKAGGGRLACSPPARFNAPGLGTGGPTGQIPGLAH